MVKVTVNGKEFYQIIKIAIIGLIIIECIALLKGFNGQLLRYVTGAILFLAGVSMPNKRIKKLIRGMIK